jgi:hypothetical protein
VQISLKSEVAPKSEPADPDLSSIPMKQVSNRTVGKRKRKLTGCSALLQTIVKSADYYLCLCKQTNTVVRELYE